MMIRQCDYTITRGVLRVAVIGQYIVDKVCQCCCSMSWTGNEWKKGCVLESLKCLYLCHILVDMH